MVLAQFKPCCPVLAQNQPHGEADLEFWVKTQDEDSVNICQPCVALQRRT